MTEDASAVFADAEKVLQEGECACGQHFMVVKVAGADVPRVLHKKPACREYKNMRPAAYLAWLRGNKSPGMADVSRPPTPNRAQRRRELSAAHKQREARTARGARVRSRRGKR